MSLNNDIYIIGIGRTAFSRAGSVSIREMAREATLAALEDAGIGKDQLSAAFFSNAGQGALEGQHMISGQIALRHAGIDRIPIVNVENACASATTALKLAVSAIRAGEANIVLALGAERLAVGDNERSKAFFQGAMDVSGPSDQFTALTGLDMSNLNENMDRSIFMDFYAGLARDHMERFGTTREQLASVASKNRSHAVLNTHAQYRQPLTIEQVLNAREVVWPLTLPMCAPLGNGAAAAIVCSGEVLARLKNVKAVKIAAICLGSGSERDFNDHDKALTRLLALEAFEMAAVEPGDVSLVEVHDATAAGEIIQTECLGLLSPGEGGPAALAGVTTLGGRLPVNTSGGLECNGHPVGATGLAQIYELVTQLRGEAGDRQVADARIGMAENAGGFVGVEEAAASIVLLERVS